VPYFLLPTTEKRCRMILKSCSGGYVGAQAYLTTTRAVTLVASVDGLAPDADVAAALRRALGARRGTH